MSDTSLLLYAGVALASLVGSYLGAYFKRKGENLATHEDLDKLIEQMSAVTETTENIKAAISDDVWDRQEQWKLKRDSIQNAVIALHEMESALTELNSCFAVPPELCDDSAQKRQKVMQQDALARFRESSITYQRTMLMIDLVVGLQLSKFLSDYFQCAGPLAVKIMMEKKAVIGSEANKERAERFKAIIKSARESLGIKDAGEITLHQPADAR